MTNKEAVKLAYTEFQKDFENGEETNQWLTNVIDGLKQAEKDLEVLEILKKQITAFEYKKIDDFDDFTRSYYLKITTEGLDLTKFNKIRKWLEND